MKANETFSYIKNNQVSYDLNALSRCYQPLIGSQGLALYNYFLAFHDQGRESHGFNEVLNHLNIGMPEFEETLDRLLALQLVYLYKEEDGYLVQLAPALDSQSFLGHQVLAHLLTKKIGDRAVAQMKLASLSRAKPLTKKLSDVFIGEQEFVSNKSSVQHQDFDLTHFKQLMAREKLRFEEEEEDLLALFKYAEQAKKTWYETFEAAKATAVDGLISRKRLLKTLAVQEVSGDFSENERQLIRWAKGRQPLEFLADIKEERHAIVSDPERHLLKQMARLGLLDAVINVLVLYTFNRTDSANLNEKFALKVANDFSYQGINSAEAAVLAIRKRSEPRQGTRKPQAKGERLSNIPEWSKETYRTEATPEEVKELQELRRQMLGDRRQGDPNG